MDPSNQSHQKKASKVQKWHGPHHELAMIEMRQRTPPSKFQNKWFMQLDIRPHRCRAQIIWSYSPGGTYVRFHLIRCLFGPCESVSPVLFYKRIFSGPWLPLLFVGVWPGDVVVKALDLPPHKSRVPLPALHFQVTILGKLFTRMCLCHQAVSFGTGQGAVMPCGWEGNRRSGVSLAMRHRLQWFIHLRIRGLRKGDEHPASAMEKTCNN